MALQIKGKFVENAAIDGEKVELKSGQSLKQKKADGTTVELIKLDESLTTGSKVRVNGEQVATQSQIDGISTQVSTQVQSIVQAETAARVAADNALDARLDIIEGADTVEGSVAKAEKDAKDYADAAVLVEKTRAESAEAALSAAITAEETARIADVNAEETRALAAESALSAAITAEEAARIAGDASTLSSANSYTDTKIAALVDAAPELLDTLNELAAALGDDPNFATSVANSVAAVQTAVNAEITRATAAESALQGEIDAEELARAAADAALQVEVDAVEVALTAETVAREAEDLTFLKLDGSRPMTGDLNMGTHKITNLIDPVNPQDAATRQFVLDKVAEKDEASEIAFNPYGVLASSTVQGALEQTADKYLLLDDRIHALEIVKHRKLKFVLSQADLNAGYIDIPEEVEQKSIVASVGRLMIHEGADEDFTVQVYGNYTRITFVGNLVAPSPEQLGEGDVIYVKYTAKVYA